MIKEVKARDFISALEPVKTQDKLYSVKRLCQRISINEAINYEINVGLIEANPAAKRSNAFANPIVKNMPALKPEELPELLKALETGNIDVKSIY